MKKKILFVCYGGGHSKLLLPVVKYICRTYPRISCDILALTTATFDFHNNKFKTLSYKDFFGNFLAVQKVGTHLLKGLKNLKTSKEDTVCYLGKNYIDLISLYGKKTAQEKYKKFGRNSFFPLPSMMHIIKILQPHVVVTTNSPRSELAAVIAAKKFNIPTLSIIDLFGVYEEDFMQSDTICVPFASTYEKYNNSDKIKSRVVLTGNPNFVVDKIFSGCKKNIKFLWCDQPAVVDIKKNIIPRKDSEIIENLNDIYTISLQTQNELIVRPHPSQDRAIFYKWSQGKNVKIDDEPDIKKSISNVMIVMSISSTALVEGAIMGKHIIKYIPSGLLDDMPLEKEYVGTNIIRNINELSDVLVQVNNRELSPPYQPISESEKKITDEIISLIK